MPTAMAELHRVEAWLRDTPFCAGLNADQRTAIAGQMHLRPFVAGETLASAGDDVTEFWIVAEGELNCFLTDPRGRESILPTVRPGETIGEVVILEKSPTRPARFTARTHGTLLVAPATALLEWVETYPQLMRTLFQTLSSRFRQAAGLAARRLPSPRLGIVVTSPRGAVLAGRLANRLLAAGERMLVWADRPAALMSTGSWPDAEPIRDLTPTDQPLLQPTLPEVDRRIVIWTAGSDGVLDVERLLHCDEILLLLEPQDLACTKLEILRNPATEARFAQSLRLVWLLDASTPVAPCRSDRAFTKADIKVPVESTGNSLARLERQGLDRLVRALRGISLGIALAGGGAKGMAHWGVLRVLEAAGISFDAMSGTSAGALVGIPYASGMEPELAIHNFQRDLTPSPLFQLLPKWPNLYLVSQFRRRAWDKMLRRYLHDWRLEQLSIPFSAVAVDLIQARTVVRNQGDAVRAILESINLPVISKPILRDGMALVDGGVLNNLPADVLVEQGVDFVVGVDVSSQVRPEFGGNRPDVPTDRMRDPGLIETVLRIFESQHHGISKLRNRAVDFWIKPNTSAFGLADFHHTTEIAAIGEAEAQSRVSELKQRLIDLQKRLVESSLTSSDRTVPG